MKSYEKGKIGEEKATIFLKKLGYKILSRNYLSKGGEIDIIAIPKNLKIISFIEVKNYKPSNYVSPIETFSQKKIQHLEFTAYDFIQKHNYEDYDWRFELVILQNNNIYDHILNIFQI